MGTNDEQLVTGVLAGESGAVQEFVRALAPVIQARAARSLVRRGRDGRDVRQELEDMTQNVYVALLTNDARTLRAWRPDGGLSLRNFVGLVAEREVSSIMRSGKRSPWVEEPSEPERLSESAESVDAEEALASRESLRLVVERLREQLSPLGLQLFELLMVEGLDVDEAAVRMNMKAVAVYAWRSRLSRQAREIAQKLAREKSLSNKSAGRRIPSQDGVS